MMRYKKFDFSRPELRQRRPAHNIPADILEQAKHGYPPRNKIIQNNLELRWRTNRWKNVSEFPLRQRESIAGLYRNENELLGIVVFRELQATKVLFQEDFRYYCDYDGKLWDMSERIVPALLNFFDRDTIDEGEKFVDIDQLYMLPKACGSKPIWSELLNEFIYKKYEQRFYSLLTLLPYPLEYEGYIDSSRYQKEDDRRLEHRIKAMIRLYGKSLHVQQIDPEVDGMVRVLF